MRIKIKGNSITECPAGCTASQFYFYRSGCQEMIFSVSEKTSITRWINRVWVGNRLLYLPNEATAKECVHKIEEALNKGARYMEIDAVY